MAGADGTGYVAECFWPGVQQGDLRALDRRIAACARQPDGRREPVRYLGSMLIVDDEVVLCMFEGEVAIAAVSRVMEQAGVPFERILRSARAPGGDERRTTNDQ